MRNVHERGGKLVNEKENTDNVRLELNEPFLALLSSTQRQCCKNWGAVVMEEGTQSDRTGGFPQGSPADWARVLGRLKREVGETAYRSWFRSMTVERVAGGEGVISVPTRFLRNWVATHYSDRLLALWRDENQAVRRISFVVDQRRDRGEPGAKPPVHAVSPSTAGATGPAPDSADDKGQLSAP